MKDQSLKLQISQLPGIQFVKDQEFKFIGVNQEICDVLQVDCEEIIGSNDYDQPWQSSADFYRSEDFKVLSGSTLTNIVTPARADGSIALFLIQKKPLFNENGKITGVLGSGLELTQNNLQTFLMSLNSTNPDYLSFYKNLPINHKQTFQYGDISFSKREAQVIAYTLRGLTAKEVSRILAISHKTVESYLSNIKSKLGCTKKSQIVTKAFQLGYIDLIFISIEF